MSQQVSPAQCGLEQARRQTYRNVLAMDTEGLASMHPGYEHGTPAQRSAIQAQINALKNNEYRHFCSGAAFAGVYEQMAVFADMYRQTQAAGRCSPLALRTALCAALCSTSLHLDALPEGEPLWKKFPVIAAMADTFFPGNSVPVRHSRHEVNTR